MRRALSRLGAALAVGVVVALAAGGGASAADGSVEVDVVASVGGPPAPPAAVPPGAVVRPAGAVAVPPRTVAPPATVATAAPAAAPGELDLAGILFVGGLSATATASPNPFGGVVTASFTVRNVSSATFDAATTFTLDGPIGNRIASVDVDIDDLAPGASRVVSAELAGSGQWGFLTASATFTPPDQVDGVELDPITREASLFAVPWLTGLGVVIAIAGVIVFQVLQLGVFRGRAGTVAA